ncbi:glutamate--cysteine ligase regulatory subunit [Nematostella vectensis]|uniref:glutamate--cysteine ligase regulatory subunit n=1 Tax=Nematostella vectensis TaxID=45351 RepID=UPI0013905E5E|nr:glutamate--cysteine ligase regulatory subunit [Nematostella vectensis]
MATNGAVVEKRAENSMNGFENGDATLSEDLDNANRILIHGGNISNWSRTKRKTTADSSDELSESMVTTLNCYVPLSKPPTKLGRKTVRFVNDCFMEKIKLDERMHLKISAKIFAISLNPAVVRDSLFRAMLELGVDSIETLILTLPDIQDPEQHFTTIKSFWQEMEQLYDSGYVQTLGVCDLDKPTLEKLYDWARIKPEIDQVNLASCCVMPKDLVEYSKTRDIQLLTHADPREMLSEERLQQVLGVVSEEMNVAGWRPSWVMRYSVLVKCRGVIKSKAYIMSCERS